SYGMIYLCRPCQAWVGVRKGTNIAPGRLANQELRLWKINAHESLDHLIREELVKYIYPKYISGISNREKTYFWIAEQLGIK
ncbi:MAG TPA: zinc-finger-containing protein, partial [Puia sp.]|nr:zinc-finger-containing protein [Puia sp.]